METFAVKSSTLSICLFLDEVGLFVGFDKECVCMKMSMAGALKVYVCQLPS